MTITALINHVDNISPNQYTTEQKTAWLSAMDGKVFREVILTHEPAVADLFEAYRDDSSELLIKEPYALDVYANYLLAKIAEANAEIPKYNLYSTLFNVEYNQWVSWYHRNHKPRPCHGWRC